jgi:hypothetical protein
MVLKQTTHRVLSDQDCWFLGALEKIRKAAISFVVSVRPSCVRIEYSASTGRILMKFDFWRFFLKICRDDSSYIKMQEQRVLYMNTDVCLL